MKTVDHLATKYEQMLGRDNKKRYNELFKCIYFTLSNTYGLKKNEITLSSKDVANENVEIRVDTRIKTDKKLQHIRPDFLSNFKA